MGAFNISIAVCGCYGYVCSCAVTWIHVWFDWIPPPPFLFFFRRAPDLTLSRTIELFWNQTIRISIHIYYMCVPFFFFVCLLAFGIVRLNSRCNKDFTLYKLLSFIFGAFRFSLFLCWELLFHFCCLLAFIATFVTTGFYIAPFQMFLFHSNDYSNVNFNWLKFVDWRNSKLPPKQTNKFYGFF